MQYIHVQADLLNVVKIAITLGARTKVVRTEERKIYLDNYLSGILQLSRLRH